MNPLGAQLSIHGVDRAQVLRRLLFGVMAGGLALFVGWGSTRFSFKFPMSIIYILGGVLLALSALWFVGMMLDALRMWLQQPKIIVYEKGVALQTRGATQTWEWRDFKRMQGNLTNFSMFGLVLRTGAWKFYTDAEKPFIVSALYAQAEQLSELLINQMVALRLPDALAALERGESLKFGDIALSRQKFSKGTQQLDWQDIDKIGLELGAWVVSYHNPETNKDKQLRMEISSIPDFPLMARLTEQCMPKRDVFVR
jgi:hypothetical protein